MTYITGKAAWDKIQDLGDRFAQRPAELLEEWWSKPKRNGFAPFQFTTKSGRATGPLGGDFEMLKPRPWMWRYLKSDHAVMPERRISCGCLTMVKYGGDVAPTRHLTRAIVADNLIPSRPEDMGTMSRTRFIKVWNRLVAWQKSLRHGLTPEQAKERNLA